MWNNKSKIQESTKGNYMEIFAESWKNQKLEVENKKDGIDIPS